MKAGTTGGAASEGTTRGAVPATYVRLLYEYLEARGLDAAALLGEPPPAATYRAYSGYPVERWARLLQTAATALDDPLLALHIGQTITPAHTGIVGYVLLCCPNLGAALQKLQDYQRLVVDYSPMRSWAENGSIVLEWTMDHGKPAALVDETGITALVQFSRNVTGRSWPLQSLQLVQAPNGDPRAYDAFFGCTVRFGQPTTQLRFPLELLAIPLRKPDPAMLAVLEQQADAMLAELPEADDLEQGVRRSIARLAREGEPTLERVAADLHCSRRTLHRRLEARGLRFRPLLEDTRRRMAESYLDDPRLTLVEIAQLLGFTEQSAFTRAFKRWLGTTPRAWRRERGVRGA